MSMLDPILGGVAELQENGTTVGARRTLNFIGGTVTDNPAESRLDINVVANGQQGVFTVQLDAADGAANGVRVDTVAFDTLGDGGFAAWHWAEGESASPGVTRRNSPGGQWQMIWSGDWIDVRAVGFKAGVITIPQAPLNTTALVAAMAALGSNGGTVVIPTGSSILGYTTGQVTIVVPPGVRILGGGGLVLGSTGSILRYLLHDNAGGISTQNPASDRNTYSMFSLKSNSVLENLTLRPNNNGGHFHSAISIDAVGSELVTRAGVTNVQVECLQTPGGNSEMDWAVTVNTLSDCIGNIELCVFKEIVASNPRLGFLRVGNRGAQPLAHTWDNCSWVQFRGQDVLGHPQNTPYGLGMKIENNNYSGKFAKMSLGSIGIFIRNTPGEARITVDDVDSEYVKKMLLTDVFAHGVEPKSFRNMRLAVIGFAGRAAYDENDSILVAAADENVFEHYLSAPLHLENIGFIVTGSVGNTRLVTQYGGALTVINCIFPNNDPLRRQPTPVASEKRGPTNMLGCRYFKGVGDVDALPDRHGCENFDSSGTITGVATSFAVAFPAATPEVGEYMVLLTEETVSGVPAPGYAYISGKSSTGFTVNRSVAPGGVAVVRVNYMLRLRS